MLEMLFLKLLNIDGDHLHRAPTWSRWFYTNAYKNSNQPQLKVADAKSEAAITIMGPTIFGKYA